MAIGVALGHFYPHAGVRMEPLGEAFIKAIRVLIAPIIFCTVVHGIAGMANMARVGRVALKALIYFEVVTTVALIIGLIAVNLWEPGRGMNVDLAQVDTSSVAPYIEQTQRRTAAQFLLGIIPNTFVGAFGEGNVLQVLFVVGAVRLRTRRPGRGRQAAYRFDRGGLADVLCHCRHRDVGGADRRLRCHAKLEAAGCEESVVGLVIPTGYSFNLDGTCLYLATAAVFLAQATNTPLPLGQQLGLLVVLLLASKGAAGVAGAAFVVLAATLAAVGTVPVESVALILGVHRLMSMALTPTNLIGNGVATLVVAKWKGVLDQQRLQAALDGAGSLNSSASPPPSRRS